MGIIKCWGFPVFRGSLSEINVSQSYQCIINTISPNSYGLSVKNSAVRKALQYSNFLVLDGLYFGWVAIFTKGKKVNRITGWDVFQHFSKEINVMGGRVFFLGSSELTLRKIKNRFNVDYPNVEVAYYAPSFNNEFNEHENKVIHEAINLFKPDVLFIGMTAPKQELWSYNNNKKLSVRIICSIGNVFDWYAGNSKRPNRFWQKIGLEWLVRIYYRPEIFKRNIGNQMLFFWHLLLAILGSKKYD